LFTIFWSFLFFIYYSFSFYQIAVNEANYFNSGMVVNEAKILS